MLARLVAAHRALASSAGRFWASAAASTVLRAALVFAGVFCGMTYATSFEAVASSGCDAVSSWPANASGNYSQTGTFAAGEFLSVYIVNYNAPGGSGMPYSSSGSLSGLGSGQVPANTSSPTPNEVHLATTVGTGSGTLNVTVTGNAQITATCTAGVTVTATASATTQVGQTYDQISSISGGGFTDQFTVSVSAGALPTGTTLFSNNGGMTVSGTPTVAGPFSYTLLVTDTTSSQTVSTTVSGTMAAGPVTHFSVSAPASATAGSASNFTVTALDAYNNTVSGYAGTVHFTSTDGAAVLPANATLTNGVGTFSATLKSAGSQTITATDTATSSITGTSNAITVNSAAVTHFSVSAPASAKVGFAFNFTVTALDAYNNTVSGYTGTAHFTSTDGAAVLPANATLSSGVGTFSATLKSAGSQTLTATDTVTSSITGTSATINVSVAVPTVTSANPASGPIAGGTSVTITGTNFTGVTAVTFGGTAATSFTFNSATSITATAPAHAAGAVNVVVTTPGGSGTGTSAYTYVTVLTLSSTPSAATGVGQSYAQANTAGGGTAPYAYAISAGSLPAGTTLNTATGLVSGAPTTAVHFNYTVKVTDSSPVPQTATQVVNGSITTGVTTTSVSSSLNPSQVGQTVTFSATVTGSGPSPAGTVTFKDAGLVIGTGTLAGGVATFSTAALTLGSHSITASYGGNGNFNGSTSTALIETVNTPADSLKLRAMQVLATAVIAQNSGQAISSTVDSAIADGFSDGGNFVTPGGGSIHFNFTSDPDEQNAATPESTVSDRWNGTFRSDGSNGASAAGPGAGANGINSYTQTQSPPRIGDAFASIDRNAMATKAPSRVVAPKEWMLWADVRASGINRWDTTANAVTQVSSPTQAALHGSQVNALMGLTRKFNPSFLVGGFGGYETFDYRSEALEGRLKGEGWTVGSYLGWKPAPDIRFTVAAAYSGIGYNGTAGTANGNFDGNRWLLSSALTGSYHLQRLEVEPSAAVYALWEYENAYTDSLGTAQADRTFFTGRASGGVRLSYPIAWTSTVALRPYVGVYGDFYFNGDSATAGAVGAVPLASTPILDGWSARLTGGLTARLTNGSMIALGAELGGIGSSTQIWTFRAGGSIPF